MDDADAIRSLIVAYAERLDAGDFDGVAALFEHATFRSARAETARVGRDAIRQMYDPVIVYDDGTPRTKHVLGNIEVTVDTGRANAASRCTFTVLQAASAHRLAPVLAGRYHDTFVLVDGAWRFTERLVLPDLVGDLSAHMRAR